MNAIKDLLETTLRVVSGVVPDGWRLVVTAVANVVHHTDWGEADPNWQEVARIVTDLLKTMEEAGAMTGTDLKRAARAAAEIEYTRRLLALGMLERS